MIWTQVLELAVDTNIFRCWRFLYKVVPHLCILHVSRFDPLLKMVASHLTWVLGTRIWFPATAVCANCRLISLVLFLLNTFKQCLGWSRYLVQCKLFVKHCLSYLGRRRRVCFCFFLGGGGCCFLQVFVTHTEWTHGCGIHRDGESTLYIFWHIWE